MAQKVWILENLDCAACAAKIEHSVAALDGVIASSVQFATRRMTIEAADDDTLSAIFAKAEGIIRLIEPDVRIEEAAKRRHGEEGHEHEHSHERALPLSKIITLTAGIALFVTALLLPEDGWYALACFIAAYALIGYDVLWHTLKNFRKGTIFDENFLMSIASLGAFFIDKSAEAVAVMLFYEVGELFQGYAVRRSRRSIASLMDIRPETATLLEDGRTTVVKPDTVAVGATVLIKPGEKVPLDGVVLTGSSSLDTAALTGESLPREVESGDEALSGCINVNAALTIRVTRAYTDSTVSKILELVENAGSKKARTEMFITTFARVYTPIVVIAAALLALIPPLLVQGALFSDWVYRALIFLVISCPCALVISVPLSYFAGIGSASRSGVLVKGGNYLEALARLNTVVFDKTGTLTHGVFRVTDIRSAGMPENDLLEAAAYAESISTHPISRSIVDAYGKAIDASRITDAFETPGQGVAVTVDSRRILCGNARLMQRYGIVLPETNESGTSVSVAIDGAYAGRLYIDDEIKKDAAPAIDALHGLGVRHIVMLTGDAPDAANAAAVQTGIDSVHARLLPGDKVNIVEGLLARQSARDTLAFVGDGINDAPVLARADIGIAMGALGSDAAIEAADVVLMTDELSRIPTAVRIARKTMRIVRQNIMFALAIKFSILLLGALGIANMWDAVFADVGVSLLAILNALRALRKA